ncbi:hypothetical protein OIU84_009780 [Salix udensis]|uniref:Uncharacterized protein n=1 Tax=Salix udensis TaxID=889485 RepID=A0AAD6NV01_9ROSI|nr:hypothetical protein OIU84_009780 [Salix udensis]
MKYRLHDLAMQVHLIQVEDTAMKVEIVMDGLQGNVQFPGEEIETSDAQKKRPATVAELSYKAQKIGKEMQRDELLLDACDLLEDERKAKTFFGIGFNSAKEMVIKKTASEGVSIVKRRYL